MQMQNAFLIHRHQYCDITTPNPYGDASHANTDDLFVSQWTNKFAELNNACCFSVSVHFHLTSF